MGLVTETRRTNAQGETLWRSTTGYDARARAVQSLNHQGQGVTGALNQNGEWVSQSDSLNRAQAWVKDALGRTTQHTDPMNGISQWAYGPDDTLLTARDPKNITTTYRYNGFGEVVQVISPDRGTTTLTRDAEGKVLTQTDARGVVTTLTYDVLGRVLSQVTNTSSATGVAISGNQTVTWTYDTCANGVSRICSRTDESGTTTWTYGSHGLPVEERWTLPVNHPATAMAGNPSGGLSLTLSFSYNAQGQWVSYTLPSGREVQVTRSLDQRLSALSTRDPGSAVNRSVLSQVQWSALDQLLGFTFDGTTFSGVPSGSRTNVYQYDASGRPIAIQNDRTRALVWDAGNRLRVVDDASDPAQSQVLDYDALDRLTQFNIGTWPAPHTLTYDGGGNRLTKRETGSNDGWNYGYGTTHHRLQSRTPVVAGTPGVMQSMTYDAMGNLMALLAFSVGCN